MSFGNTLLTALLPHWVKSSVSSAVDRFVDSWWKEESLCLHVQHSLDKCRAPERNVTQTAERKLKLQTFSEVMFNPKARPGDLEALAGNRRSSPGNRWRQLGGYRPVKDAVSPHVHDPHTLFLAKPYTVTNATGETVWKNKELRPRGPHNMSQPGKIPHHPFLVTSV